MIFNIYTNELIRLLMITEVAIETPLELTKFNKLKTHIYSFKIFMENIIFDRKKEHLKQMSLEQKPRVTIGLQWLEMYKHKMTKLSTIVDFIFFTFVTTF